jgi:protein SCO1
VRITEAVGRRQKQAVLLVLLAAAFSICAQFVSCHSERRPQEQRFALKGKVVAVDKAQRKLTVDHEAIPGFMEAMTMPYAVKDAKLLDSLSPGDQITAQVVVTDRSVWLENIAVTKKATVPPSTSASRFHAPAAGEEIGGLIGPRTA